MTQLPTNDIISHTTLVHHDNVFKSISSTASPARTCLHSARYLRLADLEELKIQENMRLSWRWPDTRFTTKHPYMAPHILPSNYIELPHIVHPVICSALYRSTTFSPGNFRPNFDDVYTIQGCILAYIIIIHVQSIPSMGFMREINLCYAMLCYARGVQLAVRGPHPARDPF